MTSSLLPRLACRLAGHKDMGSADLLAGLPMGGPAAGIRRCARCGRFVSRDSFGNVMALTDDEAYRLRAAVWQFYWKDAAPVGQDPEEGRAEEGAGKWMSRRK